MPLNNELMNTWVCGQESITLDLDDMDVSYVNLPQI